MKFLLLTLLFTSSPLMVMAQTLPSGKVKITIVKTEIRKDSQGDGYEFLVTTLCEKKLPFRTLDSRADNRIIYDAWEECKFQSDGKTYKVHALYGVYATHRSPTPNAPPVDLLQFIGGVDLLGDNHQPAPFPKMNPSSFSSRDFKVKNVLLEVFPNIVCDDADECPKVWFQAIYDYEAK